MAVDLRRHGIKAHRLLIHRNNTFEALGDELPEGAWLWRTMLGGTVELYRSGPPPRRLPVIEWLALVALVAAVCAVGLAALPLLLVAVGIAAPIAAVTLLVWAALRHHRRR